MLWFIDLCDNFLKIIVDLFYFMVNPLNTTIQNLGLSLSIPYFGESSPIMLVGSGLVMFLLISFFLRLIHG